MAFEPRITEAYASQDSITGSRDKTADENYVKQIVSYSSLKAASAVLGTAGEIFYATVEETFYGIKGNGNSTITTALS